MSTSISLAFLLVLVSCTLITCQIGPPAYVPTEGEKEICANNANGRTVENVMKDRPQSCHVVCSYSDGQDETYNSPDGQLCCDMVGVGPTGLCRNGKCALGGIF
ncbi:uncharacterized protein LOC129234424 [Uloborus diversus]|uniref:uncharacterized protein LOC129234424 n=1 Tax=Uloborus diversus TaxID=327109 RepID=UPI002409C114|nr:uncharacterized protein LOC129234424 [Uloborus diversus]